MNERAKKTMQINYLIHYMYKMPNLAKNSMGSFGAKGKIKMRRFWRHITKRLNNLGPVQKTPQEWFRTWTNLRRSARAARAAYVKEYRRTGNVNNSKDLSDKDNKICGILKNFGLDNSMFTYGLKNSIRNSSCPEKDNADRMSLTQKRILIEFISDNKEFLTAQVPYTPEQTQKWELLTQKLNDVGPNKKEFQEWIMAWKYLNTKVSKRMKSGEEIENFKGLDKDVYVLLNEKDKLKSKKDSIVKKHLEDTSSLKKFQMSSEKLNFFKGFILKQNIFYKSLIKELIEYKKLIEKKIF